MAISDLDSLRSIEELTNHAKNIESERAQLDADFAGLPFPEEAQERFAAMTEEIDETKRRAMELESRKRIIESAAQDPKRVEQADSDVLRSQPRTTAREQDIYNLRSLPQMWTNPEAASRELHDRALRANELASYPHVADPNDARAKVERVLKDNDDEQGTVAQYMLITGSPTYNRAFVKSLQNRALSPEETAAVETWRTFSQMRALSLAGAGGGFAIPFDLDPTIIPTSNGAINPLRQISNVKRGTVDTWQGVSAAAITAAYAAEATATTDNAPVLTQPTVSTEKAQAFVPFSIEVGMDWPGLRATMGELLQDAKDELESVKFAVGSGTNEPFGVITGATTTVNATAGGVFDLEDLYRLRAALPPRHQSQATFMANQAIFDKVRQFDTAGGAALWETLANDTPSRLLGRPAYENSAMTAVTTVGALFLIVGNFSRFVIYDRIGLEIELIPHLFDTTNNRPTGQRGLYAYWRNGSKVVDANAFRVLIGLA